MKQGKRILSLILSIVLLIGILPGFSMEEAEASESTSENETVLVEDSFNADTTWSGMNKYGLNESSNLEHVGVRNNTAPLGYYGTYSYQRYGTNTENRVLTDVHMTATVCVTEKAATNNQFHMLVARSNTSLSNGIGFGFISRSTKNYVNLILCVPSSTGFSENIVESSVQYEFNREYKLDLYVVGSWVLAKCDDEVIWIKDLSSNNIPESGVCGFKDNYAVNNITGETLSATSDYGVNYTKRGYFDDFRLATIHSDIMQIQSSVVCDVNGAGKANIDLYLGDTFLTHIENMNVTVEGISNATPNKYEGNYKVTSTDYGWTGIANTVYVVQDISQAVISMSDDRWTGNTVGDEPNFTVDANGIATLTSQANSVLSLGEEDADYSNFYVEYTFNASLAEAARTWSYSRYTTEDRVGTNSYYSGDVIYDTRDTSSDTFYGRLMKKESNSNAVQVGSSYASKDSTLDVAVGTDMKIGMLVYNNTITYMINDNVVATDTVNDSGWFMLRHEDNPTTSTAKVSNFRYIPISDKQLVDIEVTVPSQVKRQDNLEASVVPVYNWPYENGTAVNVTADIDSRTLGVQKGTVTYTEETVSVSKDITVEVLAYEPKASEDFSGTDFLDSAQWNSAPSGFVVSEGAAITSGSASAIVADSFADGFVEADITLVSSETLETFSNDSGSATTKTVLAGVLRRQVDSDNAITVRFNVTRDLNGVDTAIIQSFVRDGDSTAHMGSSIKLTDFAWGKTYKVRLSCIGNYYEVQVDGEVKSQFTLDSENVLLNQADTRFAIANESGTTVKWDNVLIGKYDTYSITKTNTDSLVLPTYFDYRTSSANSLKNERIAFIEDEQIVITTSEDKELKAGGLYYTLDSDTQSVKTKYSISQRNAVPGENRDNCNEFVLSFPNGNITVIDEYYDSGSENANLAVLGVSIREAGENLKAGIRFRSRAYNTFTKDGAEYTLKEVGTLIFQEDVDISGDDGKTILDSCRTNEIYKNDSDVIKGKRQKATYVSDVCNEFKDWTLCLTYGAESTLFDQRYKAYAYAIYEPKVGSGAEELVYYSAASNSYSYNQVFGIVGNE